MEHFLRLRLKLGQDLDILWDALFRAAADDDRYGDREVRRRPALSFFARGGSQKPADQKSPAPAATYQYGAGVGGGRTTTCIKQTPLSEILLEVCHWRQGWIKMIWRLVDFVMHVLVFGDFLWSKVLGVSVTSECLCEVRRRIYLLFGSAVPEVAHVSPGGFHIHIDLFALCFKGALDWLKDGVPMGIKHVIPKCGVFRESDGPSRAMMASLEFATQLTEFDRDPNFVVNYKSFDEACEFATRKVRRFLDLDYNEVRRTWSEVVA
eukprot:4825796-Amphidinium_carterae.1